MTDKIESNQSYGGPQGVTRPITREMWFGDAVSPYPPNLTADGLVDRVRNMSETELRYAMMYLIGYDRVTALSAIQNGSRKVAEENR